MATLTAWRFANPGGAEEAIGMLEQLEKQELLEIIDGAWVTWPEDKKKPKTHQLHHTGAAGAVGGGFWGLLFGLIFFIPLIGLAIGAAAGAMAGSLTDVGIDDDFIESVRSSVTPGTSALFLLTENVVFDRVKNIFAQLEPELITSNLDSEQEARLRAALADDEESED